VGAVTKPQKQPPPWRIGQGDLDAWSAPYRGWHYAADPVIPSDLKIPGHETFHSFDVPTVYQIPGEAGKWFMSFIGFNGQGLLTSRGRTPASHPCDEAGTRRQPAKPRGFAPRRRAAPALAAVIGTMIMSGCSTIGGPHGSAGQDCAPAFSIPRMPAVLIDGRANDWGAGGFRVDALIPDQGAIPARTNFAAGLRLGWNDAGLLALLEVTGGDWSEAEKITELFGRDSAEFYLARYPGSAERCQWLVAPGMDERYPEPRVHLQEFATSPRLLRNTVAPTVARVRTGDGYRMEVLLPWKALGVLPRRGDELAFQVMVNNHERQGRPQENLLWFPMSGAAFDSRKLHRIKLADEPSPPVTARARVRVDFRGEIIECEVFAPLLMAAQPVRVLSAGRPLAAGTLAEGANGFACAKLIGPGADAAAVTLDVNGRVADVVPLDLPRADLGIETSVRLDRAAGGLAVAVGLPEHEGAYRVARRAPGEAWQVLADAAPAGEFRDAAVESGKVYEYGISRAGDRFGTDYFWAGSRVPLRDRRGTVLLIAENSLIELLAPEIRRLVFDLVGDGWQVVRKTVLSTQAPAEIRAWIRAEYERAPDAVNTVLLLGRVPVFRAGHARPDGHGNGTSPADVYYGAMGDAGFDQDVIPGRVQLAVGRVDFSNMPAFGAGETALLRRYLDRDHAYRHGQLAVVERALVHDNFFGQPERFAYSGWQNFTTLLPPETVRTVTWPNVRPGMSQFFYVCGAGHGAAGPVAGFGDAATLVKTPLEGVFTMVFGSFLYEWDRPDNLLRATLAHERGALTCGWAGRPHWYLHSMGMGETIGDCLRRTQNNDGADYKPVGGYGRGIHIALLGDPTLRLHPVVPPSDLRVQAGSARGVRLNWAASPRKVNGYHVYRADAEFGPYERITKEPVQGPDLNDPDGTPAHYYQVRAVVLQESTTGSYCNSSQGIFAGPAEKTANAHVDFPP